MRTAAKNVILAATLLLGGLTAFTPRASAQGGVPLWTNRYDGLGNGEDNANALAVDSSGNVFVTGTSRGLGSDNDYATIKYSSGGVPLWTNRYNGSPSGYSAATAIAVDNSDNAFVTGYSYAISGSGDFVTIKYSAAGVPLWTNRYEGRGNNQDVAVAIAADNSGNVFVTGYSGNGGSSDDYATVAYSNVGVPLWTNLYNGPADNQDRASAIVVDSNGNVFVTGFSSDGNNSTYATVAYSNAGMPLWTNRYPGEASALAVDSNDDVFVTGSSSNGSNNDYATIKYSNAGLPQWTNLYNGPANSHDGASAVAVDSGGNVFVTGASSIAGGGSSDYATVAYSNGGVPLWARRYNGPANDLDLANAIAVDSSGNVFVTGWSPGIGGAYDSATIAYSNAGVPLWTNRFSGSVSKMVVDRNGNVFVTGRSYNGTNDDYVTIKYSSSVPPPRLDFQLISNQLVLNWTNAGFSLQAAPAVTGSFTNLSGATSPYTNPITGPQQFFRLKGD